MFFNQSMNERHHIVGILWLILSTQVDSSFYSNVFCVLGIVWIMVGLFRSLSFNDPRK